jgi:hypothetical protein
VTTSRTRKTTSGDDEEPDLDGEQLDVEQVHPDVARDDDALVEDAVEDVCQVGGLGS